MFQRLSTFSLNNFSRDKEMPRQFGIALVFILLLSVFFWKNSVPFTLSQKTSICWPFFDSCFEWRPFSESFSLSLLGGMVLSAILSLIFLLKGLPRAHQLCLAVGFLLKGFIFIQDYRLMGNFHMMPFWCVLIYIFSTHKEAMLKVLIVSFYFFAGLLKINKEWFSGQALLTTPLSHFLPIEFLTSFVVVLEVFLVWLLLFSKTRKSILIILYFFHLYSWHQVGYFYPLVMFALLSVFLFNQQSAIQIWNDFKKEKIGALLFGAFVGLQLPSFILKGDAALSGEGRYLSLNMIDAYSQCQGYLYYEQEQQWTEVRLKDNTNSFNTVRIHCEPLLYWRFAQSKCREYAEFGLKGEAHLFLFSKRSSDTFWTSLIQERNICASSKQARTFGHHEFVDIQQDEVFSEGVGPRALLNPSQQNQDLSTVTATHFLKDGSRNNFFDHKLEEFSRSQIAKEWNIGVHEAAKASPVGDSSGFYVSSDGGRLSKFDWNGNVLWNFFFQNTLQGIHSTPLLVDDYLYVGTYSGDFYKIQKNTGDLIWVRRLGQAIGASPLLVDSKLIVNTEFNSLQRWGGMVVALDPQTGQVLWKSDFFPDQSHSSPAVLQGQTYFTSNDGKVRSLDLEAGRIKQEVSIHPEPIKSSLVVTPEGLYFAGWKSGLAKLGLDGKVAWQLQQSGQNMSTPLWDPIANYLYYGNSQGKLLRVDPGDGKILREWSTGDRGIKSGLLLVGRDLFFGCGEKELCRLNIQSENLQKVELDGRVTATPFFYEGKMVVVTDAPGSIWLFRFENFKKNKTKN